MPTYAVDSSKQSMIATGVVGVVPEWDETPDGKRKPSDRQARDADTGFPLWQVEVLYQQDSWGRVSSVTAMVSVPALEEPAPQALSPVRFEDLRVDVRLNKRTGQLSENWGAASLAGPGGKPSGPRAGGES
jgi:hypothetical protein